MEKEKHLICDYMKDFAWKSLSQIIRVDTSQSIKKNPFKNEVEPSYISYIYSYVSQKGKDRCCIIFRIYGIQKSDADKLICKAIKRHNCREKTQLSRGEGGLG